jgi:DNA-binding beta-propeller fold protein YncE
MEWSGPAGPLYLTVYRKLDGSAPVALGPGDAPKFSPDGTTVVSGLLSTPPQLALNPIGAGESRRLAVGDITSLQRTAWFPDGRHLLLNGAMAGQPVRAYKMDIEGGKPEALGPADFIGVAVAKDGKRIAGRNATSGAAEVFDSDTQKVQEIPGVGPEERFEKWTLDGEALLVSTETTSEARMYRVEVPTGKRTLLQTVQPSDRAGELAAVKLSYAEGSKTYVYSTVRSMATLYVVEGLE